MLVNTNCAEPNKLRWITLTHRENMTNAKRLYEDYRRFWQQFKHRYVKAEYIIVVESHAESEKGKWHGWHLHAVVIFHSKTPFVPSDELLEC